MRYCFEKTLVYVRKHINKNIRYNKEQNAKAIGLVLKITSRLEIITSNENGK